jgi:branched-subunit amino acid aminotransferase/4-amino-4-deoxychorismate lyase
MKWICLKISMLPKQLYVFDKTSNRMLNITASIYANENGFDNCLLLNDSKNVVKRFREYFLC